MYTIPGMERTTIRKDIVYRTTGAGPLTLDVYRPADAVAGARLPAVIFVAGYNDVGYEKMLGRKFKDMAMSVSWGQLVAASGMVAIAYTNREPVADLDALHVYVRENAAALGIDEQRVGDLYGSFMDSEAVARIGVQPLLDELATIDAAADLDPHADPDLARVEEDLLRALGTKVSLARSRRGGRIVIEYYSDEELGRLYDRLTGGPA